MNAGKRELLVYSMLYEWMKTAELSYRSVKLSSRGYVLTRLRIDHQAPGVQAIADILDPSMHNVGLKTSG